MTMMQVFGNDKSDNGSNGDDDKLIMPRVLMTMAMMLIVLMTMAMMKMKILMMTEGTYLPLVFGIRIDLHNNRWSSGLQSGNDDGLVDDCRFGHRHNPPF